MKVQILDNSSRFKSENSDLAVRAFSELEAFDAYDFTVISFQCADIWKNRNDSTRQININSDLKSIATAMRQSRKCDIVILLPQNYTFRFHYGYTDNYSRRDYLKTTCIKDMLGSVQQHILTGFLPESINLIFGKSATHIGEEEYCADFHMELSQDAGASVLRTSDAGGITTVALDDRRFLSTLYIDNPEALAVFLRSLIESEAREPLPNWIDDMHILDEPVLREELVKKEAEAKAASQSIASIKSDLESLRDTKSILCTKGSELESKVREMLQEMVGDTEPYEDLKEEDYCYERGGLLYLFEIKGSTGGIKGEHISKTNNHVQIKLDKIEEDGSKAQAKGILIFADNIGLSPQNRDDYPERQITLAKRDEILVIPTTVFLRMYEDFRVGTLSKDEFLSILARNVGLLDYGIGGQKRRIGIEQPSTP